MALVTFRNELNFPADLHMRIGPVNVHPDNRGSRNTTIHARWFNSGQRGGRQRVYCFGRRRLEVMDNPLLCNAPGGSTTVLNANRECFIDN